VNGTGEISGWEIGLNGGGCTFVVRDVTIRANKTGILAVLSCDVDLANVVVSDNLGDGVAAYNVTARDVRASNNGALGIRSLRGLTAERLTATGNGLEGVLGGGARTLLVDSVVTRNAAAMDKLDVSAAGPLRLVDTECGRAARIRWKRIRGQGDRYRKVIVRRVRCAPVS
jgi:hypothetical protein